MKKITILSLLMMWAFGSPLTAQSSTPNAPHYKNQKEAPLLAHLVLQVSDINSSLMFYQNYLGMVVTEKAESEDETRHFLSNTQSHHKLVLIQKKDLPDTARRALQQIAFEVPDHQTLVKYYLKLKEQHRLELKNNQISWSIYVDDPDGNQVEIFWDIRNQPFGKEKWNGKTTSLSEEKLLKGKP